MRLVVIRTWLVGVAVCAAHSAFAQQPAAPAEGAPAEGLTRPTTRRALNVVRQGFPAAKADPSDLTKSDTAWEIEWDITNPDNGTGKKSMKPSSVLVIRSAKFMFKDHQGGVRWFTVLRNLEVGEIFVPYDHLRPVFLDVADHAFRLIPAKPEYLGPTCVAVGEILDSADPRMKGKVMKEVHDDGLRWINGSNKTRRGEKMLLTALFDGGNYRYILEYAFTDDGVVSCRLGASAHNFFSKQKDGRDVHLHVGCWRWDPELCEEGGGEGVGPVGGAKMNEVKLVRRVPQSRVPDGKFRIDVAPFNPDGEGVASEGFADWKAEEFTTLRVQSTVRKNRSKNPQYTGYDVIPLRTGTARNFPERYAFANHEYWVTRRRTNQPLFRNVPMYTSRRQSLDGWPVTVWHATAGVHIPRGEDYGIDGVSASQGAAITSWTGFTLRPVNLFDSTPLYVR
ncbi:MAG: hypothetical protein L0Y71_16135 [Gemmataceae bacterium]|nr:hypothetical protein [Gemmataceae bacterium]